MSRKITVQVDASKRLGPQDHLWRYIGYDECNYTYLPGGKELLGKFAALDDAPYYFRTHFLFCTGNCHGTYKFGSTNIYWENENRDPVYDFTYYDKVMDAYIESGNKPFIELGFMPMALVDTKYLTPMNDWDRYSQYKNIGWTCPPKDYEKWHGLIEALAQHLVQRYGQDEVKTWYFELWNEPDIRIYWSGTIAEYCKLFDYTEHALHSVCSELRLSGPAVTGGFAGGYTAQFLRDFLMHCKTGVNFYTGASGTRLDFITFHVKGGGFPFEMHAKKAVPSVESLVYQVKMGLDIIQACGYQDREVILSEADPDGWAAGGVYDNANMVFRNTEYYATYVASAYHKIEQLSQTYGMTVRPLAWAFMFPGERCFEGTRTFTTQGIDKAVFNLFKIYGSLGATKLDLVSDGSTGFADLEQRFHNVQAVKYYTGENEPTDISGFAVEGADGAVQILLYSHNNDRDQDELNMIQLQIEGLAGRESMLCKHYRIDKDHSNAYAEWKRQGEPWFPDEAQYKAIKARDQLEKYEEDKRLTVIDGKISLPAFPMPAHAVSYIVLK